MRGVIRSLSPFSPAHSHQSFCDLKFQFSDSSISTSLFTLAHQVTRLVRCIPCSSVVYCIPSQECAAVGAASCAASAAGVGCPKKKVGPDPVGGDFVLVGYRCDEALAKGRPLSTGSCKRTPFCRIFAGFFCKGRPLATGQQDLVEGLFSSTYLKDRRPPPCAVRVLAWSRCHFLIRTTPKTRGLCQCNECIGAQQTLATPGLQPLPVSGPPLQKCSPAVLRAPKIALRE